MAKHIPQAVFIKETENYASGVLVSLQSYFFNSSRWPLMCLFIQSDILIKHLLQHCELSRHILFHLYAPMHMTSLLQYCYQCCHFFFCRYCFKSQMYACKALKMHEFTMKCTYSSSHQSSCRLGNNTVTTCCKWEGETMTQ